MVGYGLQLNPPYKTVFYLSFNGTYSRSASPV